MDDDDDRLRGCMATTRIPGMDDDDDGRFQVMICCAGLTGGAQGLCNAYCNAQNCPASDSIPVSSSK
jgi:hypothetical protein